MLPNMHGVRSLAQRVCPTSGKMRASGEVGRRWNPKRSAGKERGSKERQGQSKTTLLLDFWWNDGRCSLRHCRFEHIRSRCFGPHRKTACRGRGEMDKKPLQRIE